MVGANISALRARHGIEAVASTFGHLLLPNFGQFLVFRLLVKDQLRNVRPFNNIIGITFFEHVKA